MSNLHKELAEFHTLMGILQNIDAGLVVLDRDYRIQLWNGFMEHHSGLLAEDVQDRVLFEHFPELPEAWFRRKAEAVFQLRSRVFTTWEQRPFLMKFSHSLPLTGRGEHMYQNATLLPLPSIDGSVNHLCLILYDVTEMATNRRQLEQANAELEHLNRKDCLTGLYNRGHLEECLAREYRRCRRTRRPASLIMFDIDHFKRINDTHGHPAGDEVLRQMADWIRQEIRQTDVAGRYGGEEFGLVLIDTPRLGAKVFAERLRRKIEARTVLHGGREIRCTISMGIAEYDESFNNYASWLSMADKALYKAKSEGRNRLIVAQ